MAKKKTLNQDFFKHWTPDMAYVLGFFAADGNMIRTKRGGYFISFHITDKNILQKIRRAMGSSHKIAKRDRGVVHWKIGYRLQIGSKEMYVDLLAKGFMPNKSKTMSIPEIPKAYVGDFVRGYFDGDGCVYFAHLKFADRKSRRRILMTLFTSGSKLFLQKLHEILKTRGVNGGSIKSKKRGFELVLSHKDSIALFKLMYHTIPATGLYLSRKRKIFDKAIQFLYKMRP